MSLRSKLKVPKYGLFYFECDRTLSVLPSAKIVSAVTGDNTTPGSVVEVRYGADVLKAKIIAVDDDDRNLHKEELDFLCDPSNKDLFESDSEEEGQKNTGKGKKRRQDRAPSSEKSNKKKKVGKPKENKPKQTKNKPEATVIGRFAPQARATPQLSGQGIEVLASDSPVMNTPVPDSPPQPELPRDNGLTQASLQQSPVPRPPVINATVPDSPPQPELPRDNGPTQASLQQFPAPRPAVMNVRIPHSQYTPSQHRSRSSRVPYSTPEPASPILLQNLSPLLTTSPHHYRPPSASLHRERSHLFQCSRRQSLFPERSSGWENNQLPQHVGSALRRMERQIEYLTSLVESIAETQQQQQEQKQDDETQACTSLFLDDTPLPISDLSSHDLASPPSPSLEVFPEEQGLSSDALVLAREKASSSMNFAVRVLRHMIPTSELLGKNIAGVRGKQAVDPAKVSKIKALVSQFYPAPPLKKERIWTDCRKAMDSYIRKLKSD